MKKLILLHRWLGVLACVAILMFAGSGILHPVMSRFQPQPAQFKPPQIAMPANALPLPAALQQNRIDTFTAATAVGIGEQAAYCVQTDTGGARYLNGTPCYRVNGAANAGVFNAATMSDEHAHHHGAADSASAKPVAPLIECLDTHSGLPVANAEPILAENLARFYSGSTLPVVAIAPIFKFDDEYGFLNKRLPVWKIQFADSDTHWYIENSSGALALRAAKAGALDGWIFSIFHKARFIADPYKNLRDGFLMVVAFGCIVVGLLGMWLFVRQLRRRVVL